MSLRAAVLALACLGLAVPSAAASPLRKIASADVTLDRDLPLAVHSDMRRWYAYQEDRGVIVAVDTRAHVRRALEDPRRCSLEDLRFARILLWCRHDPVARLVSLPSGAAKDYGSPDPPDGPPLNDQFFALGRYWIGGFTCDGHCADVYLNRRTMERRVVGREDTGNEGLQSDIDSPDLKPKRYARFVDLRGGGYRVTQRSDAGDPLVLTYKGRQRTLSRCRIVCASATLGGGLVTWADNYGIRAYSLRLRKTFSWRAPRGSPDDFVADVVHTSTTVLVKTRDPHLEPARERLYAAGVPRR